MTDLLDPFFLKHVVSACYAFLLWELQVYHELQKLLLSLHEGSKIKNIEDFYIHVMKT